MKNLKRTSLALAGLVFFTVAAWSQDLGGDMSLKKVLIDGQGWELVADGLGSADGPCADAAGNFYFSDVKSGEAIFKVGPDGKVTRFIENAPKVSAMKFGPDGRLYACQGAFKRLVAFEVPSGKLTVIAEDVQPNDLVVTHKGHIYFTETGKKQVTFVNPKTGEKRAVDTGITAPNGITISPDQGTLAVSDFRGQHVWVFRVEPFGSLSAKSPYMTFRTEADPAARSADPQLPVYKISCAGDGMTVDTAGRYYVATSLGVQMFDATGRLSGVILKPQEKGMSSVGFAGPNLEYMYVTCTDKIYRRKTQARGVLFFQPPKAD